MCSTAGAKVQPQPVPGTGAAQALQPIGAGWRVQLSSSEKEEKQK